VPDIGDFESVDVIDILVKPGDTVQAEDSLITLESDKATMDIPAPRAGVIGAISVKVGDKIAEGGRILVLELVDAPVAPAKAAASAPAPIAPAPVAAPPSPTAPVASPPPMRAVQAARSPPMGLGSVKAGPMG
jgi:pyruvate dehydrogenase E2 component (dihydrolipoamide acetyltransferase)